MTSYYLLDNPPATQQFYPSRPRPMSGGVLIHTTESIMDNVGPDTGAENVAGFISRRLDYGSYHVIVDSDSAVALVPDTYVAYHCGASGYNGSTWGISFACRTTDLDVNSDWTRKAMRIAAREIVGFWRRNRFDVAAANRFIPAMQTQTSPGMSTHGEAQPADRSDAWTRHPQRPQLEALLRNEIAAQSATNPSIPTPPGVDLTVNKPVMMHIGDTIWMFYSGTPFRIHVQTPADVQTYLFFGVELKKVDQKTGEFFLRNSQLVKCG
jgi:hypothetical protein